MAAVKAVTFQFWANGPVKRFALLSGKETLQTEVEPGRAGSQAALHSYREAAATLNRARVSSGNFFFFFFLAGQESIKIISYN